jgi:hypothetical protein
MRQSVGPGARGPDEERRGSLHSNGSLPLTAAARSMRGRDGGPVEEIRAAVAQAMERRNGWLTADQPLTEPARRPRTK